MIKRIENKNIIASMNAEKFELPQDIKEKIKIFWDKVIAESPNLWDGEITCVGSYKESEKEIEIVCQRSNYSHYLYDERKGLPKEYACLNLSAGCLLETSDNYYIVGELIEGSSYPHCMQVTGGNIDKNDIKDGKVDILNTIRREVKEEVNIDLDDENFVENYELKYVSVPDDVAHTYLIFAKGKLKMTAGEMSECYDNYLRYLRDNNLEVEFEKIHFIHKEKVKEELERLTNPRREYLLDLLTEDSKS